MTLLFSSRFVSRAVSTWSTGTSTGASSAPPVSFSTLSLQMIRYTVFWQTKNSQRIFAGFFVFFLFWRHNRLSDLVSQIYFCQFCIILACHFTFSKFKITWVRKFRPFSLHQSQNRMMSFEWILLGSISQVIIAPSNSSLFVSLPKQAVNSANSPSDSILVLQEDALKKIEEESSVIGWVSWSSPNQKLS